MEKQLQQQTRQLTSQSAQLEAVEREHNRLQQDLALERHRVQQLMQMQANNEAKEAEEEEDDDADEEAARNELIAEAMVEIDQQAKTTLNKWRQQFERALSDAGDKLNAEREARLDADRRAHDEIEQVRAQLRDTELELERQRAALRRQLSELEGNADAVDKQARERAAEAQRQLDNLRKDRDKTAQREQRARDVAAAARREAASLRSAHAQAERKLAELKSTLDDARREGAELADHNARRVLEQWRVKFEHALIELKSDRPATTNTTTANSTVDEQEFLELRRELDEVQEQLTSEQDFGALLQQQLDTAAEQLKQQSDELEELRAVREELAALCDTANNRATTAERRVALLRARCALDDDQSDDEAVPVAGLANDNAALRKQLDALERQHTQLAAKCRTLTDELHESEARVAASSSALAQLAAARQDLRNAQQHAQQVERDSKRRVQEAENSEAQALADKVYKFMIMFDRFNVFHCYT